MQDSNDSNDVLPKAITYFYPPDEQMKNDKLLDCGEIVGVVQYFQHDLFRSMIRALNFQKLHVVHQHYGRHSGFLCVPDERYTPEEAHVYLQHILDLFNLLYGTWNHIQSIYQENETVTAFLNEALTPIINYVLNQHRSITNLFSMIEYTPLKSGNQRVLLDTKHYLGYLKSKYGLIDGFIGYDDKILYSTCDPDMTYCLQILCQSKNEISENLISMPWESEFRLKNGVSLYHIYMRQPAVPTPPRRNPATTSSNVSVNATPIPSTPVTAVPTAAIPIFQITSDLKYMSDDSPPSSQTNPHRLSVPASYADDRRSGKIMLTDPSGSSEETGFDTDTADELSSPPPLDLMSTSSLSLGELSANELSAEESDAPTPIPTADERPITDDDKIQDPNPSRTSTVSEEGPLETTIKIDRKDSVDDLGSHFHWEQVDSFDTSDDEEAFQISNRGLFHTTRERSRTVTSETSSEGAEHLRNEAQVSWKNIPEKNTEHERNQSVLYVQKNSRIIFVGIIEESLLSDDYLNKLWNLMISQLANIDAQIQVIPTANELIKLTPDVRFEFNENTRLADFRRSFDGMRYVRRIPTEDSTYMAYFARTELNRNAQRKVIGISRGSQYVSIDRRLPDRIIYSCQRFQESQ